MPLTRARTLVAIVLVAITGAGCQTQVTTGPADHARSVAEAFLSACARGATASAADLLTPSARSTFADDGAGRAACLRFLGFDGGGERLSAVEREELLRRTDVAQVTGLGARQFTTVELRGPHGDRRSIEAEQRGDLWLLARPDAPEHPASAEPARQARTAAGSFIDLCAHGRYGDAEQLLTTSGRADFLANGADARACVLALSLSKPKEELSASERDDILAAAKVADVSDVKPTSATLKVESKDDRKGELEAEDHVTLWELTKPNGTPRDAAKSFLDACSHEQYETAKDLLDPSARTAFARHGADVEACLQLLGLPPDVKGSKTEREELLEEAKVSHVDRSGDSASVDAKVPDHGEITVPAKRHGESWELEAPSSA